MKILMIECWHVPILTNGHMPLFILEIWMSIMLNITYKVITYRREEKCTLDWKKGNKKCSHFICTDF